MVKTYGSLNERFPILNVVGCADTEKNLLKELFVTVYGVGYGDGQADAVNKPSSRIWPLSFSRRDVREGQNGGYEWQRLSSA